MDNSDVTYVFLYVQSTQHVIQIQQEWEVILSVT